MFLFLRGVSAEQKGGKEIKQNTTCKSMNLSCRVISSGSALFNNWQQQKFSALLSFHPRLSFYFAVRPIKVEILSSNQPFSADRKYELPCQAYGSRPPSKITWWMDEKELLPVTYNHTQTVSIILMQTIADVSLRYLLYVRKLNRRASIIRLSLVSGKSSPFSESSVPRTPSFIRTQKPTRVAQSFPVRHQCGAETIYWQFLLLH